MQFSTKKRYLNSATVLKIGKNMYLNFFQWVDSVLSFRTIKITLGFKGVRSFSKWVGKTKNYSTSRKKCVSFLRIPTEKYSILANKTKHSRTNLITHYHYGGHSKATLTILLHCFWITCPPLVDILMKFVYCSEAPLEGCQGCQLTPLEFWRLASLNSNFSSSVSKNLIDTPRWNS